jgi:hypothetical protein
MEPTRFSKSQEILNGFAKSSTGLVHAWIAKNTDSEPIQGAFPNSIGPALPFLY